MAPPPRPSLLVPKPDPDAPPPLPLTPDLCAALRRASTIKPDTDAAPEAQMLLTAENCAAWRRELEPSPDDHSDLAHRLRLAQQHLDILSARISSAAPRPPPVSPPPPSADQMRASASSRSRTRKPRSSRRRGAPGAEMVRAKATPEEELLTVRAAARRARLTFEALRGLYRRRASSEQQSRAGRNRADMRALTAMLARGDLCLFREKRIVGAIPGVLVGDVFSYRAELIVVGLHNHTQGGIGWVPASLVTEGHPVATSIVSSGGYLDDRDSGDLLVYTGSGGGRPRNGGALQADQEFERGNLALVYSCKYGVEVRVIRCHDCDASPSGKLYVYDGLYKVQSSTYGPGKSGHEVCQFNLVRIQGQDQRGSSVWHAARELNRAIDSNIRPPGYVTLDLSKGKEAVRVPVCNKVDQDRAPLQADYLASPRLPPRLTRRHRCCNYTTAACGGLSGSCACVKRNGGCGPAYNADGTLVRGMPVVYECGAHCGCPASCPNRVTQRGMKHRLEVFRSEETEWGVRTLDLIQPGAFICEFTGDLVAVEDHDGHHPCSAEAWGGFVDPRRFPPRWREWGDASAAGLSDADAAPPQFPECPTPGYVLDVSQRRNFAPYICHSSAPNAFVQFVIRGEEDASCPHLMVFAMETIPPMRELCLDYGIDQL
ncbi:unnamed protein product [Alopecurus aequalis]